MITKVSVENFKSLHNTGDIEVAPITILCGINSCGKSSFLESILLAKQNMEGITEYGLVFNGDYSRLGDVKNAVYKNDISQPIMLNYEFTNLSKAMVARLLGSGQRDEIGAMAESGILKLSVSISGEAKGYVSCYKVTFCYGDKEHYFLLKRDGYKNVYYLSCNISVKERQRGSTESIDRTCFFNDIRLRKIKFNGMIPDENSLVQSMVESKNWNGDVSSIFDVFNFVIGTTSILHENFSSIEYIGPLREAKSRRYIYDNVVKNVGAKGENAAFVYQKEKDNLIDTTCYCGELEGKFSVRKRVKLRNAVDSWMSYMGINSFNVHTSRDEVITVSMQDTNTKEIDVNIADVGFGISQVFPIVLEGLRMAKGGTLLLEQPEIHLHPKLQMQIGDYMLALAKSGRNFLVETHSDHLINRLVRRIVEDETGELAKLVKIFFVTPSKDGAQFENVVVDDTKGIVNWPEGFFDQAASEMELIIKAGIKKRKQKIQQTKGI